MKSSSPLSITHPLASSSTTSNFVLNLIVVLTRIDAFGFLDGLTSSLLLSEGSSFLTTAMACLYPCLHGSILLPPITVASSSLTMTRPDLRSISASRSSRVSFRTGFSFLMASPPSASSSPSPRSSPARSFCLSISASSRVLCCNTPAPSIVSRALSRRAASSSSSSPFTGPSCAMAPFSSRLRLRDSKMSSSSAPSLTPTSAVSSSSNFALADSASCFLRCMASIFFLSFASFFLFLAS
mmetsp:Transcript_9653/g.17449  ORF Transcript_9653/g.17449 Transcript_9653/m.17449 type:complete len:240 (+) Transcript_9653:163-882(+)